ncbi:ABC transporter permease subunit [Kitasatospora sp. NPDC059673]|uniref:ABC transporter permease subunit n=1 Tax=Kitasatospora sp. NPDC059673 TaxID=3346901 RepID=UPI00367D5525
MSTLHPTIDRVDPPARFTDLLAAEWIKLRSLRSIPWFLLVAALTIIGMNANGARVSRAEFDSWTAQAQAYYAQFGALHDAFTRPCASLVLLMMGALGAIAILSEQTTGLLRTTFAAVPARTELMAAKLVVVAATATGFGLLVASVSFWLDEAILAGRYGGVSIGDPGALRLLLASVLLAPVGALVGLALGAVIRHSVTAMVALFALLFMVPMFVRDNTHFGAVVAHAQPFNAWDRLGLVGELTGVPYPSSIGGAWTVYPVWAALAVLLALFTVPRRDQ